MRKSYVAVEVPGAPRARKQKKTRALLSERAQVPSDQSRSVRGQDWGEDTRSTISDYARGLMSTFTSVEKYCMESRSALWERGFVCVLLPRGQNLKYFAQRICLFLPTTQGTELLAGGHASTILKRESISIQHQRARAPFIMLLRQAARLT